MRPFPYQAGGLGMVVASASSGGAVDPLAANVVSLVRGIGADGSTTITDDTGRIWTRNGSGIEIDTAQSVYGGSSILFPGGSGNYLDTPDTANLTLGTSYWTLEVYIRPATVVGDKIIMGQWSGTVADRAWLLYLSANVVTFAYTSGGSTASVTLAGVSANTWVKLTLDCYDDAGTRKLVGWRDTTQVLVPTNFAGVSFQDSPVNLGLGGRLGDANTFAGHIAPMRLTVGVSRYNGAAPSLADFLPLV